MEQIRALEKEGLIQVTYRDMGSDVKRIDLPVAAVEKLCQREGMEDSRQRQLRYLEEVRAWSAPVQEVPWLRSYYEDLIRRLEAGKIVKEPEDPDLFRCLNTLAELKEPVWERVFSCMVFKNSKKFRSGGYREKVISVLKNGLYGCPFYEEGMTDDGLLTACGILTYSQTLEWKGPLQYQIMEVQADTSALRYGCVLNAQTLEYAEVSGCSGCVSTVMTIENKANYENMAYAEDTLYIYCHGFFSPKEFRFLSGLRGVLPAGVKYLHWGDMDYGGIRIYQYIKRHLFPELVPYRMDARDFEEAIRMGAGIGLEESTREKLENMDAGELDGLKQAILRTGKTVEQEMLLAAACSR